MSIVNLPKKSSFARIRIIGIGGSGKNVVNHMIKSGIEGVEFIVANTDAQDLDSSKAEIKIHLGSNLTKGLGTGMNPIVGQRAAEESKDLIKEHLKGTDLLFISCGLGGGTGTGAAPVVAEIAKDLDILTVAVITKPFTFEGGARKEIAEEGLNNLSKKVDALLVIPNDNILKTTDLKTSMSEAFELSDNVLLQSVRGIADIITKPGEINVDFADVKMVLKNAGPVIMGIGKGKGLNRVNAAISEAINSPLIDESITNAKRILFSIKSKTKKDITMHEVESIAEAITSSADKNAKIIFGTSVDKNINKTDIVVTVLASSFDMHGDTNIAPRFESSEKNLEIKTIKGANETYDDVEKSEGDLGEDPKLYGEDVLFEDVNEDEEEFEETNKKRKGLLNRLWN